MLLLNLNLTLDLIEGIGDAEPFCRSNAIKYLSRFGKKGGKSKQDILKQFTTASFYHFVTSVMKIRPPMKLSDKPPDSLKNFSNINQSILFKEGDSSHYQCDENILAELLC